MRFKGGIGIIYDIKEITPEQDEWVTQKVLYDYCDAHRLGSVIVDTSGDYYIEINGEMDNLYDCETWDEAEKDFLARMQEHFLDESDYYNELYEHIDEFIDSLVS